MDRDEALELLRGGPDGVKVWNHRRKAGENIPGLNEANLRNANLMEANLQGAALSAASLWHADLSSACLDGASLWGTDFRVANLHNANLRAARLQGSHLKPRDLRRADLSEARVGWTTIGGQADLSAAKGLESVVFEGPCTIGTDILVASKGRIPESFLRGCGLLPWEILATRLYDPALTAAEINDLFYKIFEERTKGPIFLGGVFISYSHTDSAFVDKIHDRLQGEGAPVWLDRHDAVSGPLQKQVDRAIRINDIVLLVLSEASVESNWVEHELEMTLKKEKEQKRDVLCPVALDDSWKAKMNDVEWRQVKKKNVLDFSDWQNEEAFEAQFAKLLKGLKLFYPPAEPMPPRAE